MRKHTERQLVKDRCDTRGKQHVSLSLAPCVLFAQSNVCVCVCVCVQHRSMFTHTHSAAYKQRCTHRGQTDTW
jgi:hypothetical protein